MTGATPTGSGLSSLRDEAASASSPKASIPSADDLRLRLLSAVRGIDEFSRNWNWRSHSPKQRAESAVSGALTLLENGVNLLAEEGVAAEQVEAWTARAISLWLSYEAAGARTANPMITGPANFPAARNRKAMETERKRGEEYYGFADHPGRWLQQQKRRAAKAALSAEAATVEHLSIERPGVRLVQNTTLNRIQLLFDGKPEPDTIAQLKREAFRWSPREGAWQRQNTNNGVQAAYRILRFLGHGAKPASGMSPGTAEIAQQAQGEAGQPGGVSRDAQTPDLSPTKGQDV